MPFTPAQQSAIIARNPELLVSAAAGSGKTAVLIERIYSLIREDGHSLDRMLVCTFTHAAAAEMRERLETRLLEAAAIDPRMQRQVDLVETARISTLHSFCQKLIREHFQAVDIDPQAGLCDEATRARLRNAAIEQCLDESFEMAMQPDESALRAFLQKFSQKQATEILEQLHTFLMAQPHPFAWLSALASHVYTEKDLETGPMAQALLMDCQALLDGALCLWEDGNLLTQSPYCREKYVQAIQEDGLVLETLVAEGKKGLSALMQALRSAAFGRFPSYRLTDPQEIEVRDHIKALRGQYRDLIKDMNQRLPKDPAQALSDLNAMTPALAGLSQMVERMHSIFMEHKSRLNLIDFADQEHMALAILSQPELQRKISAQYDAVFVDEYQDISAIQEAILSRLRSTEARGDGKKPQSFFYVGDVKQSIYRFRQADPTLFLSKLHSFDRAEDAPKRKITLNHNFRSRESVLSAVNRIFSHVMREEVTEINYDEDAKLHPGLPSVGDAPAEIHVLDSKGKKAKEQVQAEAALIAQEINRRVGQPMLDRDGQEKGFWQYRDMVILLPAAKGVADVVEQALAQANIPAYSEDHPGGMESPEIRQALAHLRLLDNGMDDLSLLAALRGPVYAMTEAELAKIRLQKPERTASFLDALTAAAQSEDDPELSLRCTAILKGLSHERFLERSMPLDEYLWSFLSRSGMYGFYGAQPGGRLRQANLRMLCSRASEHIRLRGGNLRDFLVAAAAQQGLGGGDSPSVLSPWEDAVRIMTIHKSKGLEFPLVFVMSLGKSMHNTRGQGSLLMHQTLGVALNYVNEKARTTRDTLLGSAISLRKRAEEKAERSRMFYVALTRAREQFIAIGTGNEKLSTVGLRKTLHGQAYSVREAKSMLEWLCQTLENTDDIQVFDGTEFSTAPLWKTENETEFSTHSTSFPHKSGDFRVVFHIDKDKSSLSEPSLDEEDFPWNETANTPSLPQREERLSRLLEDVQPQAAKDSSAKIPIIKEETPFDPIAPALTFAHYPLKLGVTAFVRSLSEGSLPHGLPEDMQETGENPAIKRLPLPLTRPRLLSDLQRLPAYLREPEAQTGLLRGVATHKALSLIPLDALGQRHSPHSMSREELEEAVKRELTGLSQEGRLTPEELARVQIPMLAQFFGSPIGQRMLRATEVRREWSFNLRAPELCESILQGVIDLCFLEDGGWTLVDYKTDRTEKAEDLWKTYGLQIKLYCRALEASTGFPVREASLFALSLGESASKFPPFQV